MYDIQDAAPPALQFGLKGAAVGTPHSAVGGRGSNGIKPSTVSVTLPATSLKAGDNTITITTTSGSWIV